MFCYKFHSYLSKIPPGQILAKYINKLLISAIYIKANSINSNYERMFEVNRIFKFIMSFRLEFFFA